MEPRYCDQRKGDFLIARGMRRLSRRFHRVLHHLRPCIKIFIVERAEVLQVIDCGQCGLRRVSLRRSEPTAFKRHQRANGNQSACKSNSESHQKLFRSQRIPDCHVSMLQSFKIKWKLVPLFPCSLAPSFARFLPYSAAAPDTISIISLVIAAWRTRFMCSVSASIMSEALLVAESIAVMRAACSAATDSVMA